MGIADMFNSAVQWIKDFWNNLDLQKLSEKMGGTSGEEVQAGIYFGVFFATGFLFKKYFKFVLSCLIVSIILIKVAEYNGFLQINMEALKTSFGMVPGGDWNALINTGFDWIKQHVLVFVSSVVGFLVGYKLG